MHCTIKCHGATKKILIGYMVCGSERFGTDMETKRSGFILQGGRTLHEKALGEKALGEKALLEKISP